MFVIFFDNCIMSTNYLLTRTFMYFSRCMQWEFSTDSANYDNTLTASRNCSAPLVRRERSRYPWSTLDSTRFALVDTKERCKTFISTDLNYQLCKKLFRFTLRDWPINLASQARRNIPLSDYPVRILACLHVATLDAFMIKGVRKELPHGMLRRDVARRQNRELIFAREIRFFFVFRLCVPHLLQPWQRNQRPERSAWEADFTRGECLQRLLQAVYLLFNQLRSINATSFQVTPIPPRKSYLGLA